MQCHRPDTLLIDYINVFIDVCLFYRKYQKICEVNKNVCKNGDIIDRTSTNNKQHCLARCLCFTIPIQPSLAPIFPFCGRSPGIFSNFKWSQGNFVGLLGRSSFDVVHKLFILEEMKRRIRLIKLKGRYYYSSTARWYVYMNGNLFDLYKETEELWREK